MRPYRDLNNEDSFSGLKSPIISSKVVSIADFHQLTKKKIMRTNQYTSEKKLKYFDQLEAAILFFWMYVCMYISKNKSNIKFKMLQSAYLTTYVENISCLSFVETHLK